MEATETIGERILREGRRALHEDRRPRPTSEARLPRQIAPTDVSAARNLRSFLVALLLVGVVLLGACALGLLIAVTFYGYGGLA